MSSRRLLKTVDVTHKLLLAPVVSVHGPFRCYSSSNESVLDKSAPSIKSPFDNPRRVYRVSASRACCGMDLDAEDIFFWF